MSDTILVIDIRNLCYYWCMYGATLLKYIDCFSHDFSMVLGIFEAVIKHFKTTHPEIEELFIKTDNASNYKNELVVSYLNGLKIEGVAPFGNLTIKSYLLYPEGDGKNAAYESDSTV